jgi:hypothetical protein
VTITGSTATLLPALVSSDALVALNISMWNVLLWPAGGAAGFNATVMVLAPTSPSGQTRSPCVVVTPVKLPPGIVR